MAHHDAPPTPTDAPPSLRRIALAGNPNVGKTTLFNLLTGLRQKVANYPGVTVERKSGRLTGATPAEIIDLPGTYSLNPKSLDERIAYDMLVGRIEGERPPDLVVCVTDATNLERNLYLASQVMDLGLPTVIALNMMDAAEEAGLDINASALSHALGIPVIPMTAARKKGMEALREALLADPPAPAIRRWTLMSAVASKVHPLTNVLASCVPDLPAPQRFSEVLHTLANDQALAYWADRAPGFHQAVLDARTDLNTRNVPYRQAEVIGRYGWLSPLVAKVVTRRKNAGELSWSDRLDAVLTHRIAGPLLFLVILAVIFQAVFSWATPAMDLIEGVIAGLSGGVRSLLPRGAPTDLLVDGVIAGVGNVLVFLPQILLLFFFLGLMEDTGYMARTAFIMDRIMSKVGLSGGSVVPLLSSFACAIPGIMAARTLANERDRLITIMVAPLMSCSARLPVYTLFIAAFIPAGRLFGFMGYQGLAMFSMYLLGTVMAFVAAWVLKRFVFKGDSSYFAMELPPYRLPQFKHVLWRMVERSKLFVLRAGKIIFLMSIVLWFLASYPKADPPPAMQAQQGTLEARYAVTLDSVATAQGLTVPAFLSLGPVEQALGLIAAGTPDTETELAALRIEYPKRVTGAWAIFEAQQTLDEGLTTIANEKAGYQVRNSFIGMFGRALEPVMRPLGFDWKISAGIVTALAAREVIISALATLYSVGDADETSPLLKDQLKADTYPDGSPVYTPLVAVSLLIFFVFALQCISTLAIARRETNSWRWPAVMWLYMTGLAYLFSFIVYQGGLLLGLG